MRLRRAEVVEGYPAELQRFEDLLRSLSDAEWQAGTRCDGWVVADVAAHVTGTLAAITEGRIEDLADPAKVDALVTDRRGRSRDEGIDEFAKVAASVPPLLDVFDDESWSAAAPGGVAASIGEGVEALWYDTFVHSEDIRAALGRPSERPQDSVRVSIGHLADVLQGQEWGPATLAFDGLEEFAVGDGSGRKVTGDPYEFINIATGRADPATLGLDETVNVYR
ncbi:MAG: hypothetical protein QOG53_358 [Frankiales bacterium]|jgi:uncharacterized protein (TIGR03083 family)|nr:hypothetical protein [Frankiales bacterium]